MKLAFSMVAQVFLHFRLSGITTFTCAGFSVFLFLLGKQYRHREETNILIHTDRKRNRAWGLAFFRRYDARAFSEAVAIANACAASQE